MGQAPNLDSDAYGRRFRGFGKHDIQVRIGLIEELFEIKIIHQHNPHDCGESGKVPSPFLLAWQERKQEICDERNPYLNFDGICAFTIEVSMREVLFYLLEKRPPFFLPVWGCRPTPLKMAFENSEMVVESIMRNRFIHSSVPPRRLSEEITTFAHGYFFRFSNNKDNPKGLIPREKCQP